MEVREGGREKYLLDLPAPGAGTDKPLCGSPIIHDPQGDCHYKGNPCAGHQSFTTHRGIAIILETPVRVMNLLQPHIIAIILT